MAPEDVGAWAGVVRNLPPFLSGIPTSAVLVAAFLGQLVLVAAPLDVPVVAPVWSHGEVQTDLASPLNDLAVASDHACSALDNFSSGHFERSCVPRCSPAFRQALCGSELLLVGDSEHLRDAAPSGVEVCTDRLAFVDCSEILVAQQDGRISAARRDDEVWVFFVGPLDSVVSFVEDVAVSDQVVLDLVVRVLDLVVRVLDLEVRVFDLVED